MKKLSAYLRENKITYEAFGERIKRTKSQVWKYAKGDHIPPRDVMKRIVKVTNGEVPPASFYD